MNRLTCAIVEDDKVSLAMVEALAEKTGLLDVKATFTAPAQAMPWLVEHAVDLLFLDVEMPGMTGIELLRSLPYKPHVIIISASTEYAAESYDLAVTDYLIKPIKDYSRFLTAVNKALTNTRKGPAKQDDNFFVRIDSLLLRLNIEEILWIEAFGDYIKIQTADKVHTVYATLKKVEEKITDKRFVRVHRSYIVNVTKITNIDPNNLEINKKIIPISGTYKEALLNRISIL
jgi:DNA-binding LytR/AlgR family response regulator